MTKPSRLRQSLLVAFEQLEVATKSAGPVPAEGDDCFQVYQRELGYLVGSLRRLAVPFADIEDVLHEVFLVMVSRWDDFDRSRAVRPWLFGIAFRVASSYRRKGAREVLGASYDVEDSRRGPDDDAAASENRALLLKALAQVPMERRAVLIMYEVDETPMGEIAQQLSIPLFTAYSRLRKARRELDDALARLQKGGGRAR